MGITRLCKVVTETVGVSSRKFVIEAVSKFPCIFKVLLSSENLKHSTKVLMLVKRHSRFF